MLVKVSERSHAWSMLVGIGDEAELADEEPAEEEFVEEEPVEADAEEL